MLLHQESIQVFSRNNLGAYILNIQVNNNGEEESINTGINVSYSSEYDINKITQDTGLLNRIAQISEGRLLTEPKEVFEEIESSVYGERDIDEFLFILALLLIVFDIAFRRIGVLNNKIEELIILSISFFKKKNVEKVIINKKKNEKLEKKIQPQEKKSKNKIKKEKKEVKEIETTTSTLLAHKRKMTGNKK